MKNISTNLLLKILTIPCMYKKLKKRSEQEFVDFLQKIYIKCNEDIDNRIEKMISRAMSKNNKRYALFFEEKVSSATADVYDDLFNNYYSEPYTKSILNRLREKFPGPEFKCSAEHVHYSTHDLFNPDSPDVNYYVVLVEWDITDCRCILF